MSGTCGNCRQWVHGIDGARPCACPCHAPTVRLDSWGDVVSVECWRCRDGHHGYPRLVPGCGCSCHRRSLRPYPNPNQPSVAATKRRRVLDRDGWCCRYCGRPLDRGAEQPAPLAPTVDHVTPGSRGGSSTADNLVACCWADNKRKRDRTPEEAGMVLRSAAQNRLDVDAARRYQLAASRRR